MFKQRSFFSTVFLITAFFLLQLSSYYSFLLITAFFLLQLSSYYSFLLITGFYYSWIFKQRSLFARCCLVPAL